MFLAKIKICLCIFFRFFPQIVISRYSCNPARSPFGVLVMFRKTKQGKFNFAIGCCRITFATCIARGSVFGCIALLWSFSFLLLLPRFIPLFTFRSTARICHRFGCFTSCFIKLKPYLRLSLNILSSLPNIEKAQVSCIKNTFITLNGK